MFTQVTLDFLRSQHASKSACVDTPPEQWHLVFLALHAISIPRLVSPIVHSEKKSQQEISSWSSHIECTDHLWTRPKPWFNFDFEKYGTTILEHCPYEKERHGISCVVEVLSG